MHTVATYASPVHAQHAVRHLLENGVLARTHHAPGDVALIQSVFSSRGGAHEVVLFDKLDKPLALELLQAFNAQPPREHDAWDEQAEPDLNLLPEDLTVPCASCGYNIRNAPMRHHAGTCPECAAPFELLDRVFEALGPEALAECYPEPEPPIPDALIDTAPLTCLRCRYPLLGSPRAGNCPECGQAYDKLGMIRAFVLGRDA